MRRAPSLEASYVHQHNDLKYHALLVRAIEIAKQAEKKPKHVWWMIALGSPQDAPELCIHKELLDNKKIKMATVSWSAHGWDSMIIAIVCWCACASDGANQQETGNMEKHCTVISWDLHPDDRQGGSYDGERMLKKPPLCI